MLTEFENINKSSISVKYVEIDSHSPKNQFDSHVHSECEIYVNLSGDVSFIVEKSVYPIVPGSIIITRPYEHHHLIYHSDAIHKHFWILLSVNGNEKLLDSFFNRKLGEGNLLSLSGAKTNELIALLKKMSLGVGTQIENYGNLFSLLNLIEKAQTVSLNKNENVLSRALKYIGDNFTKPITVLDVAESAFVSVNTLERHFTSKLSMTPSAYIRKRRLANAAEMLSSGYGVKESCEGSGFADCSAFITFFKKSYGTTPHKYRKEKAVFK